jgi:predicted nucleotidyltransferase
LKEQIIKELQRLEENQDIRILYAAESGSRAWGFASTNSDWDVRFFYVHRPEWYLSIDERKDSFEKMLPNDLDLAGWEFRKTLKLFRKSNPPLYEWLGSPIIYLEPYSTADKLRELSKSYFNPIACTYHYLSMAQNNYKQYMQHDLVRVKKYFYAIRPLLACKWIEETNTMAPVEFQVLVDSQVSDPSLKREIDHLLQRKRNSEELDKEPKNGILVGFIERSIEYFTENVKDYEANSNVGTEPLDELLRSTLEEVW